MIIAPIALFLIVWPFTHILVAAGIATIALAILLFAQVQLEGDAITADCPSCGTRLQKEAEGNIEYFVCHRCKTYAIGRSWS